MLSITNEDVRINASELDVQSNQEYEEMVEFQK